MLLLDGVGRERAAALPSGRGDGKQGGAVVGHDAAVGGDGVRAAVLPGVGGKVEAHEGAVEGDGERVVRGGLELEGHAQRVGEHAVEVEDQFGQRIDILVGVILIRLVVLQGEEADVFGYALGLGSVLEGAWRPLGNKHLRHLTELEVDERVNGKAVPPLLVDVLQGEAAHSGRGEVVAAAQIDVHGGTALAQHDFVGHIIDGTAAGIGRGVEVVAGDADGVGRGDADHGLTVFGRLVIGAPVMVAPLINLLLTGCEGSGIVRIVLLRVNGRRDQGEAIAAVGGAQAEGIVVLFPGTRGRVGSAGGEPGTQGIGHCLAIVGVNGRPAVGAVTTGVLPFIDGAGARGGEQDGTVGGGIGGASARASTQTKADEMLLGIGGVGRHGRVTRGDEHQSTHKKEERKVLHTIHRGIGYDQEKEDAK